MNRLDIAAKILAGMCAGDWQMQIPEGQTWDDVAIPRAFKLADQLMSFQGTLAGMMDCEMELGEKND